MSINNRNSNFKESTAHSSVQVQPVSNAQSGSTETTSSALFNSALITGGQFTAAANANHRHVTININAMEDVTPQPQNQNRHESRQTTNRSRKRRRGPRGLIPATDPLGPVQRSNETYERHLRLKKRGHPLWIPQSNMVLPIPYRAQGVRVGDVGIFTENGGFDFLFNICVPRDDPINPRNLPDNFTPISPPVDPTDIRKFAEFSPGSYLASSSVAESRTDESSGLIFESSASEGAILTMPEGAYSEDLSNFSRVRQYIVSHAEDWYKFVNGPRGREAQNGDLHVVVGCDKTTSWGMATFADSNLSQETNVRLKFSALGEQQSQRNAGNKYMWEHSGVAEVRVGPGRGENEELGETDSNRLRNQSLFLRTLNVTLSERVWEEIFPHLVAVADQNPQSGIQDHPKCSPRVISTGHSYPGSSSGSNSSQNLPSRSHHSTNSLMSSNSTENYVTLNDLVPPNLMPPFGNLSSHDVVNEVAYLPSMSLDEEMELEESFDSDSGPSSDSDCFTDMFFQDSLDSTSEMKCVTVSQPSSKEGTSSQISSNTSPTGSLGRYEGMQCDSTSTPDVILTRSSSHNSVLHPSKIINQYLLKHVPQARVAVTHDKDWSSIIDMVPCHSDPSQFFSAVCNMNDIVLDNDTGLVYLELKEKNEKNGVSEEKAKVAELIKSIKDGRLRLDQYLFGSHNDNCLRLEDLFNLLRSNQPIPMETFMSTHPERPLSLDELLNKIEGDPHAEGSIHRQSIISLRTQLSLLPTRHADQSGSLLRLGDALVRRFSQWDQKDDLEEAIWSYKEALSLIPNSHYYYLEALLGLCSSLYRRYCLLGHSDDLNNLLLYLDMQCDILKRQPSLLSPVEVRLRSPSALDARRTANQRGRGRHPTEKSAMKFSSTATPRGRGSYYNVACDACARKKIKCDGNKPICRACQSQGRENECTWVKNNARKPRTEAYIESLQKQIKDSRKRYLEVRQYTKYLESQLDVCSQYHHPNVDFRANRPQEYDALLGKEDDSDIMMGRDDNDQNSDIGIDSKVMAISIPPQSLQVEPFTQPSRFPAVAENPDETYVLMVDGAHPSHHNHTLDWSRHLPSNVPLDRPTHDRALDLLFKFFTSWCLRIVPALFLRDMYRALGPSQTPPKTPHYSPMLHNALVALALAFTDEPFNDIKTRQIYAATAKSFIEAECRKPNLSVVHALSVLSSYHNSLGDQTLGYMYFGMSARISQAMGLNHDFSEWVKLGIMDEADRLDRHWASWTNFTQDVCWSLYVGRDFCVAEPIGAPMPHIDPKYDEMPWFHPPAQIAPQPNNLTKTFEATCRLLMIARRIMDVIIGLNKTRSRALNLDNMIDDIDARLNMWRKSLSEDLEINTPRSRLTATPHKLMLHMAYWWLVILLHRPFFHRKSRPIHISDSEIDHVRMCRQAAEQIMELLSTWRTLYKLRYCPVTLIQTAFSAGTVYLLMAMKASSGTRVARKELRHSLDQETLVQQYLQEIGVSWNCATHISVTLRRLMDEQVRPHLNLMDRKNSPITPDLHIPVDIGEEENNSGRSRARSSSSKWSSATTLAPPRSSSSECSSTTTLTPAHSSSSGYSSTTTLVPHFSDDPFFGNGKRSSDDVEHGFGGLASFLANNFQQSPSSESLGMLSGQTLSETPFVGFLGGVEDNNSFNFSNFLQDPFAIGFPNRESSSNSLGEHVPPSHGDNDSMDLDNMPWMQPFTS